MAEKINSINICDVYHADENENLPYSEKYNKEFELAGEFEANSTSRSCISVKDALSQNSTSCLEDGLSNELCEEEMKIQSLTNAKLTEIDENPNLQSLCSNNDVINASPGKTDDFLDITLNQSHDSFGLSLNEINNENVKDEEFHDAVQFFKDPSSFSFLENKGGSSLTNDFTRSSICKNFDPLHAKFSNQDSNKINILQCINEASVEPESFCDESKPKSVSETLVFCDESQPKFVSETLPFFDDLQAKFLRGPMDSVLISFSSPLTSNLPDAQGNHDTTIELPPYPEKNLNQTCKVELEVPELLLKNEPNFQCEVKEKFEINVSQIAEKNDRLGVNETQINAKVSCGNIADIVQHDENTHVTSISREAVGNTLISFDSPLTYTSLPKGNTGFRKIYTEEELQQALKIQELQSQEILIKKQQEMELEIANIKQEMEDRLSKESKVCCTFRGITEELSSVLLDYSTKQKDSLKYIETLEQENSTLKGDVKTLTEDLQSVENTFSDFHKRYEQCKVMLKVYKDNEENFKLLNEKIQNELKEQKEMYALLQLRMQEIEERANLEVANEKKSNDAQLAVLQAQLMKAELKISGLESDNKQLRIKNSKLDGICDDLMARVSGT